MPDGQKHARGLQAGVVATLLAAACAAPREPVEPPPPLRIAVAHFSGTVLTGPTADAVAPAQGAEAWGLRLRVALVDRAPGGDPLAARLVVVEGLEEPFAARSELALGIRRTMPAGDLPRWEERRLEALVPGGTTVLVLEPATESEDAPRPAWEQLELELSRRGGDPDRVEFALALTGLVTPPRRADPAGAVDEPASVPPPEPVRVRENLVLESAPQPGEAPWQLVLPAPSAAAPAGGIIVELELVEPSAAGTELAEAEARARAALEASRAAVALQAESLSGEEGFRIQTRSALASLSRRDLERPALLYLAGETGAELVAEIALVADAESLADLLAQVRANLAASEREAIDVQALGWLLESSAWRWLAGLRGDEQEEASMPPELAALLLREAGELGRYADLMADAVERSDDVEALRARIVSENRVFLEDADPAARVRAFDWLSARGQAPVGYAPLASSSERRAALMRLEEAAEQAGGVEEPR